MTKQDFILRYAAAQADANPYHIVCGAFALADLLEREWATRGEWKENGPLFADEEIYNISQSLDAIHLCIEEITNKYNNT